ncbi:hypothetical protein PG993_013376 [Apiospora rasikravindrae]|uniref:Ankyrin repeat protein n=1 Tax=Apiospora rasikravindrae TaxID=990691 RepID=A0ABR1RZL1_9PEZI
MRLTPLQFALRDEASMDEGTHVPISALVVQALLRLGADPNRPDAMGRDPLEMVLHRLFEFVMREPDPPKGYEAIPKGYGVAIISLVRAGVRLVSKSRAICPYGSLAEVANHCEGDKDDAPSRDAWVLLESMLSCATTANILKADLEFLRDGFREGPDGSDYDMYIGIEKNVQVSMLLADTLQRLYPQAGSPGVDG